MNIPLCWEICEAPNSFDTKKHVGCAQAGRGEQMRAEAESLPGYESLARAGASELKAGWVRGFNKGLATAATKAGHLVVSSLT